MDQDLEENEGRRVNPTGQFTWRVYMGGYTWIRVGESYTAPLQPEARRPAGPYTWFVTKGSDAATRDPRPYILSSGADPETENRDARCYQPLMDEPGLFRAFAATPTNRKSILKFANRYGRLGGTVETERPWQLASEGAPEKWSHCEPLRSWAFEILFMRTMVDFWIAIQARNETMVKKHILWKDDTAVFESGAKAASLRLPPPPERGSEGELDGRVSLKPPYVTELDSDFHSLKVRGWIVHPNKDIARLFPRRQEHWIEAAQYFIQVVINRKLIEHSIARPRLGGGLLGDLRWVHIPCSLIGLLWLQFADSIARNQIFRPCVQCERWFEVTQNSTRTDKAHCSQTCRVRAYRSRQYEARKLYSLGATVPELAERFGSNAETIEAWVGAYDGSKRRPSKTSNS